MRLKRSAKISLNRETLRILQDPTLKAVGGGALTANQQICSDITRCAHTCNGTRCGSCTC